MTSRVRPKAENKVIEPTVRLDECEALLSASSTKPIPSISVPSTLAGGGAFGLESLLVHLVVSLARRDSTVQLRVPALGEVATRLLQDLAQRAYGLAALALLQVVDSESRPIPSHLVRGIINKRLVEHENPTFRVFSQDEGLHVLSLYGHQHEFAYWPFSNASRPYSPSLQSRSHIEFWLSQRLHQVLPKRFHGRFDSERIEHLSSAAYELLENTLLHGRLNENGAPLSPGVRGVSLRVIQVPFQATNIIGGGNPDVNLYFAQRALKDVSEQRLFLEISVFDSGLGYYRWINARCNDGRVSQRLRDLSESQVVRECFLTHASSTGADGSGIGLFRVMKLMKLMEGFVRIRTGSTGFYSRLDRQPETRSPTKSKNNIAPDALPLKDWFPKTKLADCNGTSIVLTVPLTTKTGK